MSHKVEPAKLLEGKVLATEIREEIKRTVEGLVAKGCKQPGLLALQAGTHASSSWYIEQQEKWAQKLGIYFEKIGPDKLATQENLIKTLKRSQENQRFDGIFLAMPLPEGFDADEVLAHLDPRKDVEGIHPASLGLIVLRRAKLIPPTAYAALRLIESTGIPLRGKRAVIIGQSAIVGRPLQLLLGERRVTTIVCNTGTPVEEIESFVASSDIVVACAGSPNRIKGAWIRPGAVVIDVGTTEVEGKLVGDVEFEKASQRAGFITPVPGGVGPLTVTMLFENLMHAYQWQQPSLNG